MRTTTTTLGYCKNSYHVRYFLSQFGSSILHWASLFLSFYFSFQAAHVLTHRICVFFRCSSLLISRATCTIRNARLGVPSLLVMLTYCALFFFFGPTCEFVIVVFQTGLFFVKISLCGEMRRKKEITIT